MNLSKFLAQSGNWSRRQAGELVKAGQVSVNGRVWLEPFYQVQPVDIIKCQGRVVNVIVDKRYFAVHKPLSVLSTCRDEMGKNRPTILDVLKMQGVDTKGLFPVGRLDYDSSGLLLLTSDGEWANQITHPRYAVPKTYLVEIDKTLSLEHKKELLAGVRLRDGKAAFDDLKPLNQRYSRFEVCLHSGKNRIIRRMFFHFGYEVVKLKRQGIGKFSLRGTEPGQFKKIKPQDVF